MKKLNRKGFTLIELLAVIVTMAIIVVVTVPTIINTISDARVNSLWNLSVATANSYDTIVAQDMIATNKVLDGINLGTGWKCIGTHKRELGVDLVSILDLPVTDLNLGGDYDNSGKNWDGSKPEMPDGYPTEGTCSLIRLKDNGKAEIVLIAKKGGKFDVSGKIVYAYSYEDKGATNDA